MSPRDRPYLVAATLLFAACAPLEARWLHAPTAPHQLYGVEIKDTALEIDVAAHTATAKIVFDAPGDVALEAAGLTIERVRDDRGPRRFQIANGQLRVARVRGPLVIDYAYALHEHADGVSAHGSTLLWPYYCGNVFPCHSQPSDGSTFSLVLRNVPAGLSAIYPRSIATEAPAYMLAWSVNAYTRTPIGHTTAGTELSTYSLAGAEASAHAGSTKLTEAFDWYERTLGPYAFGKDAGSVAAPWGREAYGGVEHHPYWHVAQGAMHDPSTHRHEAAHGWFGDGVRMRCWEDFVLSEGTASYLTARVTGVLDGPEAEAKIWADYAKELEAAKGHGAAPAWPRGCNHIDVLADHLYTPITYMQGAFFYKDVAAQIGADRLDAVLHDFYVQHVGHAAGMQDVLDLIQRETGFDPKPLAETRLRTKY